MSGRGDHNKKGTSGQGAGNQSNQGFTETAHPDKSAHGKQTGGKQSEPQQKTRDRSSNRNTSFDKEED